MKLIINEIQLNMKIWFYVTDIKIVRLMINELRFNMRLMFNALRFNMRLCFNVTDMKSVRLRFNVMWLNIRLIFNNLRLNMTNLIVLLYLYYIILTMIFYMGTILVKS